MIQSLQAKHPYTVHAIYTGDVDISKDTMLENVKNRFNIDIDPDTVDLIYLKTRGWVEASRIAAYVHYPTISTDMLASVKTRAAAVNNSDAVASSLLLSHFKIWYYRMFALFYGVVGSMADNVMVNSTWTKGHIAKLWGAREVEVVFPPCDTRALASLSVQNKRPYLLSVAQFRPEKNHALQLKALAELFRTHPEYRHQRATGPPVELIVLGSVRDALDQARVDELVCLAKELQIQDSVRFVVNANYSELLNYLESSPIGLHTMVDEHFGISVVELMAAGLVPIAHNSAGPKKDILSATHEDLACYGFLAQEASEYS
ncbi:asparagine-linked glycosylation protein, partial [Massospora cicadina]